MRGPQLNHQQTQFTLQTAQQHAEKLAHLTRFRLNGAFSFETPSQVGMAYYSLSVTPNAWQAHVQSALNIVSLSLGGDAHHVWLVDAKGHKQVLPSLKAYMLQQLGFSLPCNHVVLGRSPAPGYIKPHNQ